MFGWCLSWVSLRSSRAWQLRDLSRAFSAFQQWDVISRPMPLSWIGKLGRRSLQNSRTARLPSSVATFYFFTTSVVRLTHLKTRATANEERRAPLAAVWMIQPMSSQNCFQRSSELSFWLRLFGFIAAVVLRKTASTSIKQKGCRQSTVAGWRASQLAEADRARRVATNARQAMRPPPPEWDFIRAHISCVVVAIGRREQLRKDINSKRGTRSSMKPCGRENRKECIFSDALSRSFAPMLRKTHAHSLFLDGEMPCFGAGFPALARGKSGLKPLLTGRGMQS